MAQPAKPLRADAARNRARVLETAYETFAAEGLSVPIDEIARRAGVGAGTVYRHFPTKEDLLFTLMREHMEALLATWETASPTSIDPAARLAAFVRNHIRFHVERRRSTHVSNMELRSLSRERLSAILKLREGYEKQLRQILREGAEAGNFQVDDPKLTAMAIIQMITGVIVWFRPDERLSVDEVAHTYLGMTLRLVGAKTTTVKAREAAYV